MRFGRCSQWTVSPGPFDLPRLRRNARIYSNTATVIRSSCAPLLEPAPGYFLRLMPFSENSLVTGRLDDVMSRNGRNVASHTPAVREIWRLPIGNLQTNEDLLSTLHTNADDCGRPAIGRMRSRFKHFRDIGSASLIGFITPSGDSHC